MGQAAGDFATDDVLMLSVCVFAATGGGRGGGGRGGGGGGAAGGS
jgi:hypothetical protein